MVIYRKDNNMDIITRFDPANAQKAHNDTILAGPVLPTGLFSPFDHAWGYLNGPGAMEPAFAP